MKKEGYSRPGLFGTINHYDTNGHKVGHSSPGLFGTMRTDIKWDIAVRDYLEMLTIMIIVVIKQDTAVQDSSEVIIIMMNMVIRQVTVIEDFWVDITTTTSKGGSKYA